MSTSSEPRDPVVNYDNLHANGNLTIVDLAVRCGTEADAWKMIEELRWPDGVYCAHCGNTDVHYIAPDNGSTRTSASGSQSARRVWKCHKRGGGCGKQFTATVGTIMHRTKMPIRNWLFIMFEMAASKNGVAAREIQRKYKISHKAAWHVLMRIREAMGDQGFDGPLSGPVAADETFVGGKVNKMNRKRAKAFRAEHAGTQGGTAAAGKTPILSMIEKETGTVRSRVVNDVTSASLRKHLDNHTIKTSTDLETDQSAAYVAVGREMRNHRTVDHSKGEYARGPISTNIVESYFSQLKRSLDGTHHHCSAKHLGSYVGEFDYRYNTRRMNDSQRLANLIARPQFMRPLPYNRLLAR